MKAKISVDLPSREKLLAGLDARSVHPALARAGQAVTEAEHLLERRRRELADHERTVAELPARIHRGEVKASALREAMRERDAAALLIASAEATLAKARERVPVEEKAAKLALDRELDRRAEPLERLAREIGPVLSQLRELSLALSRALHPQSMGLSSVDWPCGTTCDMDSRIRLLGDPK